MHLACQNIWQVSQSCISDGSYAVLNTAAASAAATTIATTIAAPTTANAHHSCKFFGLDLLNLSPPPPHTQFQLQLAQSNELLTPAALLLSTSSSSSSIIKQHQQQQQASSNSSSTWP